MNEDHNTKNLEAHRERLLHVLPQRTFHAPLTIMGSSEALNSLGEALISASRNEDGVTSEIQMYPADREYYSVRITPSSVEEMVRQKLPYAQLGHEWELKRTDKVGFDWPTALFLLSIGFLLGWLFI